MEDELQPSEAFADLFFGAIDHAYESVAASGGPLIPFAMIVRQDDKSKHLNRFVTDRLEDAVQQARAFIDGELSSLAMYAIAWDGYVTIKGERTDAVLVEAAERNARNGVLFCQRYRFTKGGLLRRRRCERIGNPTLLEYASSRFAQEVDGGA